MLQNFYSSFLGFPYIVQVFGPYRATLHTLLFIGAFLVSRLTLYFYSSLVWTVVSILLCLCGISRIVCDFPLDPGM